MATVRQRNNALLQLDVVLAVKNGYRWLQNVLVNYFTATKVSIVFIMSSVLFCASFI